MYWLYLEQLLKIDIYHVNMMLECNLKLVGRVLSLANAAKALVNLHTSQDFVE